MSIKKIEIISIHTNGMSKKRLHLKCDWCNVTFYRNKNVPRLLKRETHFCGNKCAGKYKYKNMPQVRTENNLLKSIEKQKNDKKYADEIKKKRQKTCQAKYDADSPLQSKQIQKQCNDTLKEKYGVDNPQKSKTIQEKTIQTSLKRYGTKFHIASKEIRLKSKQTSLKRYGVEYPILLESTKKKIKNTCLTLYGVENPGSLIENIKKAKQTNFKKYGAEHYNKTEQYKKLSGKRFVEETGELVVDWLENASEPKPTITTLSKYFTVGMTTTKELEQFLENWRNNKTSLEMIGEQMFNLPHYNKKPKQLTNIYKPDFKASDTVYVNVDGLYWHSETIQEDRRYHFNMRIHFEEHGLRIIQFREDEIREKPEMCRSIVNNAIGASPNKIYARKCTVKTVPHKEAVPFLKDNHMMGSTTARHIGLYDKDKLVSLMSYKEKKHICKIERFCSIIDHNIVGGFSKLINFLEKQCLKETTTEIHNWVDLRYGVGNHLIEKGFEKRKRDDLGWKWTDYTNTFNRLRCKANMDERKLTQQEHADELGWVKIYDAGQRVFIKHI